MIPKISVLVQIVQGLCGLVQELHGHSVLAACSREHAHKRSLTRSAVGRLMLRRAVSTSGDHSCKHTKW